MSREKVKLITGNYLQVAQTLALPSNLYQPDEKEKCLGQMSKDLQRTFYFCKKNERENLIATLMALSDYLPFYVQGDFDGRFFTKIGSFYSRFHYDNLSYWVQNPDLHLVFGFCYLNDAGVPCAFSISYFYDPLLKEYFFNLAVVENVTAPPLLKRVTYISHPKLLPAETEKKMDEIPDIAVDDIPSLLAKRLKSKSVFNLVRHLTSEYPSALLCCRELEGCFPKPDNIAHYADSHKIKRVMSLFHSGFFKYLLALTDKAEELRAREFDGAWGEMFGLVIALDGAKDAFIKGDIKLNAFINICEKALKTLPKEELQSDRGVWGKIINGLLSALNVLTRGAFAMRPTDSMFKINKMSEAISSLSSRLYLSKVCKT